jgi:hypothetical protein
MSFSLKLALYLALAAIGYGAGSLVPRESRKSEPAAAGPEDSAAGGAPAGSADETDDPPRDPRSGATFAESRERLRSFAKKGVNWFGSRMLLKGQRAGAEQLEVERIFSLASREEVLAFFAEEDLAELAPHVISTAYARLATFSPEEAVAIWTDQLARDPKGIGVDGIVRTWAAMDTAAAERWVDGLEEGRIRDTALAALLDGALDTSPELVERRLLEVKGMYESMDLVSRLARVQDLSSMTPLAERLLSERRGKWEYQNQLVSLLGVWGERDGEAMMAWLLSRPPGSMQDHVIPRVTEIYAKKDPAAFVQGIGSSLKDNDKLAEIAGLAWLKWIEKGDETAALEWFEAHGDQLKVNEQNYWYGTNTSRENSERVISILSKLPESELRTTYLKRTLQGFIYTDPKLALTYAQELLPPGAKTDEFLASTLGSMASQGEPEEALAWALQNLSPGDGQNDSIRYVMGSWAQKSPIRAVDFIRTLPENLRENAYNGLTYVWPGKAPEQFIQFLRTTSDPAAISALTKDGFWQVGYNRGGDSYLSAALELPNEAMRSKAVEGLFGGWAQSNLETSGAALDRLEPGPLRDVAINAFVSQVASSDRLAAVAWSLEIGDAAKRRETTLKQAKYWLGNDRPAALRWIESSEKLPDEWRAELLKPNAP